MILSARRESVIAPKTDFHLHLQVEILPTRLSKSTRLDLREIANALIENGTRSTGTNSRHIGHLQHGRLIVTNL